MTQTPFNSVAKIITYIVIIVSLSLLIFAELAFALWRVGESEFGWIFFQKKDENGRVKPTNFLRFLVVFLAVIIYSLQYVVKYVSR